MNTQSQPISDELLDLVTDELLAHGEFSSIPGRSRGNARVAAQVVIDMITAARIPDAVARASRSPVQNAGVREAVARRNYTASAISVCVALAEELACNGRSADDVAKAIRQRFDNLASPPAPQDVRGALTAGIRAAKLALFVINKAGVMPNHSWEGGFKDDLAKAEAGLAALAKPTGDAPLTPIQAMTKAFEAPGAYPVTSADRGSTVSENGSLCSDCPPLGDEYDGTRCIPCPRRRLAPPIPSTHLGCGK